MASNDTKGRLDLLSLLTEELSAGETVVDVSDKTKLRYALYLRKSTDREDKQQKSIEDQKAECYKNIIERYGIKITEDDNLNRDFTIGQWRETKKEVEELTNYCR